MNKLITDLTGLPHTRHPYDAGGAYWAVSVVCNPVVCLVSGWLYSEFYESTGKIERTMLLPILGALSAVSAVALVGFFLCIERKYLRTFVSFETARGFTQRFFEETEGDDEKRIRIFEMSERLWAHFEPDVRAWVSANYSRWRQEQSPWLTDAVIATIPDELLPNELVAELNMQAPAGKRKSLASMSVRGRLNSFVLVAPDKSLGFDLNPASSTTAANCASAIALPAPTALLPGPAASGPSESSAAHTTEPRHVPHIYRCDYRCGFTGIFELVAQHEEICANRADVAISSRDPEMCVDALQVLPLPSSS